ncbi:MAG TPA: hypothetical protein VGB67_16340 [Fibrella sp.]
MFIELETRPQLGLTTSKRMLVSHHTIRAVTEHTDRESFCVIRLDDGSSLEVTTPFGMIASYLAKA